MPDGEDIATPRKRWAVYLFGFLMGVISPEFVGFFGTIPSLVLGLVLLLLAYVVDKRSERRAAS